MMTIFRRFSRSRDGNVLITSALVLPLLIGMAALVTEYGGALVERANNQRIADLSAYAGALAYNATSSTDQMTRRPSRWLSSMASPRPTSRLPW
ncbi:pilus assembly protein TadG-related protein [Mesorhizobium amorphae]|uniref:Putative Flp pilus-assembly TadG-like N-terminal domain-containing protein n=1 Tax=Mesorhizobium amorphae CCNWGS0123 TaxID=1082933 RepID=G6YC20_9HYPH|nr:pilus assembly protein TadG-related protein [Mesorhizobium amorphae]ANT51282.1 hypothetical protein A6B35_15880 [Mesorhizobium amorphae CCNWGS0123]EHH10694.1 hypothetical protein MEA186_17488 [Mesorhizobium amorphae CCNWGS0123]